MLYILSDLLVLTFLLTLSFDRRVVFYKSWPAVFASIMGIVLVFGAWDVWKTAIEVWSFGPHYAGPWRFLGLPLGEWLFFVCVPYACMFILACVRSYSKDQKLPIPLWIWYVMAGAFVLGGFLLMNKTYTWLLVVLYDNNRNLSIRLGAIPLEDFFFSLSIILNYI